MPAELQFDTKYTVSMSHMNTIDYFRFSGYTTSSIVFDKTSSYWKIEVLSDTGQFAITNKSTPPFGTHDFVLSEAMGGIVVKVNINACEDKNEFNCEDGSCIPIEERCNSKFDCNDGTDERDCERIAIPKFYLKHVPAGMIYMEIMYINIFTHSTKKFEAVLANLNNTMNIHEYLNSPIHQSR